MIHRRQHLKQGDVFPFREESSKRQAFHLLLFGGADMEAAVGAYVRYGLLPAMKFWLVSL
jgi:hypothetical protein